MNALRHHKSPELLLNASLIESVQPFLVRSANWRFEVFFTRISYVAAFFFGIFGALQFLGAILVMQGYLPDQPLSRYTTAPTPGAWLDHAVFMVLVSVALGTLAEISRSLQK